MNDICLIETLCTEHKLEFDWVKEDLLKEFHERILSFKSQSSELKNSIEVIKT